MHSWLSTHNGAIPEPTQSHKPLSKTPLKSQELPGPTPTQHRVLAQALPRSSAGSGQEGRGARPVLHKELSNLNGVGAATAPN